MINIKSISLQNQDGTTSQLNMFTAKARKEILDRYGLVAYKEGEEIDLYYQKMTPRFEHVKENGTIVKTLKHIDNRIQVFKRYHAVEDKSWRGNTHRVYENDEEIEKDFECL